MDDPQLFFHGGCKVAELQPCCRGGELRTAHAPHHGEGTEGKEEQISPAQQGEVENEPVSACHNPFCRWLLFWHAAARHPLARYWYSADTISAMLDDIEEHGSKVS